MANSCQIELSKSRQARVDTITGRSELSPANWAPLYMYDVLYRKAHENLSDPPGFVEVARHC